MTPRAPAVRPSRSAGETAGNARRFARIVTSGTSWKWNSSSGDTPHCAASVVPAAIATGFGRNPNRSESGEASSTIPAVAATESWNPIARTSEESTTSRIRTAPARIVPELRGRPANVANSASPAITPALSTDGSAPVTRMKNTTTRMIGMMTSRSWCAARCTSRLIAVLPPTFASAPGTARTAWRTPSMMSNPAWLSGAAVIVASM